MKTIKKYAMISASLIVLVLSSCVNGDKLNGTQSSIPRTLILNPDYSSISIITTKNNAISEVAYFRSFEGSIDANYKLSIVIQLNSLETNIPIRNERIGLHLFQTKLYPTAEIHTQLAADQLTPGIHEITFDVDLHGVSSILKAEFMVFEQKGNKTITLHKPLIINAATFGLENGINALKSIAKLDDINTTVPVNIILSFEAK